MRPRYVLACLLVLAAPLACTGILGDFTQGAALSDAGSDTGKAGDVVTTDVTSSDAGDAGSNDADAAPYRTLPCVEGAIANRVAVSQKVDSGSLFYQGLLMSRSSTNQVRVATNGNNSGQTQLVLYAFAGNETSPSVNEYTVSVPGELLGLNRYTTGFVALAYENIGGGGNELYAYLIDDSASAWASPIQLTSIDPFAPGFNDVQGQVNVIDPTGEFFVTTFDTEGTSDVLRGQHIKQGIPSAVFQTIDKEPTGNFSLTNPGVAIDGQTAYLFLSANGPGDTTTLRFTIDLQTSAPTSPDGGAPLTALAGYTPFVLGMQHAVAPAVFNVGFLEADLDSFQAQYRIGQVTGPQFLTFDMDSLPATPVPTVEGGTLDPSALLVNQGSKHWDPIPAGPSGTPPATENLLVAVARGGLSGSTSGVNFQWWDMATGIVRASQVGPNALAQDVTSIQGVDVGFSQNPAGSLASFGMAYIVQTNGGTNPGTVWYTTFDCAP